MTWSDLDPALLPGAEERELLRESLRGWLQQHWPSAGAVERSADRSAVGALWQGLVAQGLAALGSDATEGGLREAVLTMEELGRAAAPAPLAGALLANLLLGRLGGALDELQPLHRGTMRLAVSLSDAPQGLQVDGDQAGGRLLPVDGGLHATHLLAPTPEGLALIDLGAGGVHIEPARALGLDGHAGWSELRLHNAPSRLLPLAADTAAAAPPLLRLLLLARAHGAARRAFELAVDYAKERRQFGQPIGRFQAVQHKLANGLIALEAVRLLLQHAASAFDLGHADWRHHAAAAVAFGAPALRQVSLETHHAFGAIGYAEEHEAPRHFRRAHLDTLALGGAAAARRELAARLLDEEDGACLPADDLGPAGNAFRDEVREWLQSHWTGERKAAFDRRPFHDREFDAAFAADIGKTGWIGLAWPKEHGGQARSPREQLAFIEEMERAEAPRIGASVQANALLMHGTPAQRARYLPEILSGQAMHGMGYSEPDAGSDLAALRTRAVLDRDANEWVINGQKIWTTTWWGRYMFLAARTDADAKPAHAGISMFIVPMDAPGITVKPATTMYDGSFANIFYDDVRIPAENIVGPAGGGWKVLTDALANERGSVGGGIVLKVLHAFELLCRDVRATPELRRDPLVRDRIAALAAEVEAGRRLMLHCAELAESGTTPPEMGAISKVFSGELMERFGEAALDILGPSAALSQGAPGALRNGRYEQNLRHSLMWVISIGTNEIQRSLIAQRGLGLPR
ncbi:MAG: acyl-CoA dehydrogenase family protein [Proteobacteria bacterium]|nr:acyl-CoA dehydrogenase family protein [Pseudomonadota bacterium]